MQQAPASPSVHAATPRGNRLIIAFTALALCGVLLQFFLTVSSSVHSGKGIVSGIVSFLGYFTILTNLLVCISLILPLAVPESTLGRFFAQPQARTGVATSILFVGLAYYFLLRNSWNPHGLQLLANVLMHYVTPLLYFLYWALTIPKAPLRFAHAVNWGAYPTLYLVYAIIRGRILGSYPYAFIDAANIGYTQTLINGVGLLLAFIAIGLLLVEIGRVVAKVRAAARPL
jgi:hypothetical protein